MLAQPPGVRSCRRPDGTPGEGGTWSHCAGTSTSHIFLDLAEELSSAVMGESDSVLYRQELAHRMRRAQRGDLLYGPDARRHDVCEMESSRKEILELRHDDVTTVGESGEFVTRHGRLYFTERATRVGELLSVAFFTKAPGPLGLEEQDGHVKVALGRLLNHEKQGR